MWKKFNFEQDLRISLKKFTHSQKKKSSEPGNNGSSFIKVKKNNKTPTISTVDWSVMSLGSQSHNNGVNICIYM